MMMKRYFLLWAMGLIVLHSSAQGCLMDSLSYSARVGFSVGGTSPVGLPATIRKLNRYRLTPSFQLGLDAERRMTPFWGVLLGLRLENKGMDVDAQVKNYHMAMDRGGQHLEGQFTGDVRTKVNEWMFTIPLLATAHVGKTLRLKAGPYFSYVLSRHFDGYAYDGYLRVGSPTGPRINIGKDAGQRGDFDFSDSMRRTQWGVMAGADWWFSNRLGGYLDLNWGLTGVHHRSFKTIEQTLYPIFGTVGVAYQL